MRAQFIAALHLSGLLCVDLPADSIRAQFIVAFWPRGTAMNCAADAVNGSLPYRYFVLLEPGVGLDDAFEEEGCCFAGKRELSFCKGAQHGGVDKGLYGRVGI